MGVQSLEYPIMLLERQSKESIENARRKSIFISVFRFFSFLFFHCLVALGVKRDMRGPILVFQISAQSLHSLTPTPNDPVQNPVGSNFQLIAVHQISVHLK